MNTQLLDYVRVNLRIALVDDSGGTKGQLEAFAECPPADRDKNTRRPIHMVELDNGRGGVRRVKAENSTLYVMETRSRLLPMPPISDNAFASCAWRRAVLELGASQQAWIKYCYGFDLHFGYQIEICRYIWDNYEIGLSGAKLQNRVKQRLISLVWLAAQEVASRNNNELYKEYAATALANFLCIHRDTWYRTYAEPWREFKALACGLDIKGLVCIGQKLLRRTDNN
jgi:hypothetical protein